MHARTKDAGWYDRRRGWPPAALQGQGNSSCNDWPNLGYTPMPLPYGKARAQPIMHTRWHTFNKHWPTHVLAHAEDLARAWLHKLCLPNGSTRAPLPGSASGLQGKPERSWRFHLEKFIKNCGFSQFHQGNQAHFFIDSAHVVHWRDRRQGWQQQDPTQVAGDFILRRADGLWAYQLAVVVDDADQGITHIVRGEDVSDNTPRRAAPTACAWPTPPALSPHRCCVCPMEQTV